MSFPTQTINDLDEVLALTQGNFVVHDGTDMKRVSLETLKALFGEATGGDGAGPHNGIYRGKYLGTAVTAEQYDVIDAGTFKDLYIGDYWTIGGFNWRIAAFDYFYKAGDTACMKHHVTLVPDNQLYTAKMNDSNVTTGGYVGSAMYTTNLENAKTTIKNAFGAGHILTHRLYLVNAVTNGKPSGAAWVDSSIELMTEEEVYGAPAIKPMNDGSNIPTNHRVEKSQFPLFFFRPDLIISGVGSAREWYWLQDVVSAANFADVSVSGHTRYDDASNAYGVRPRFSIVKS